MNILNNQNSLEGTKEICNIALDVQSIQHKDIYTEEMFVYIPYIDKDLLKAVSCLVDDTVMTNDPGWIHPDYNNSKLSLFIDAGNNKFNVCLSIEAIPLLYTEEEKTAILSKASKEKFFNDDDWNEYDNWKMIFASAEAWHNKENNYGVTCTYPIEMTQEEQDKLMWTIINYI